MKRQLECEQCTDYFIPKKRRQPNPVKRSSLALNTAILRQGASAITAASVGFRRIRLQQQNEDSKKPRQRK